MFVNEPFGGLVPGAQGAVLHILLRTGVPLTGRQVQKLTGGVHSLTAVQSALRTLVEIGVIEATPAGRALLYTANVEHAAIPALQELMDPREQLRRIVQDLLAEDSAVVTVILFGSAARGEAQRDSDVDIAVLTTGTSDWDRRWRIGDDIERRFGGSCDVLVFDVSEFEQLAESGLEPVVADIVRDRYLLYGEPVSHRAVRAVSRSKVSAGG